MSRAIRDLCHPLPLSMAAIVAINDHALKAAWPGLLTGKLSDVAGLVFFPVLLVALADVCSAGALGRDERWRRRVACVAALLTGGVFAALQLSPALAAWAASWWGVFTPDPTDLLTLPALGVALWWLLRQKPAATPTPARGPRRRLRPSEVAALLSCALISAATPARPPDLYKTVRAYPIWRFDQGTPPTITEGCVTTTVWIAKSGKTGVGVMANARNDCEHAVIWRTGPVHVEARQGADVRVKASANPTQPEGLLVSPRGGESSVYVPVFFDNESAWDAGARQGTLRLWQSIAPEGAASAPKLTAHAWPMTHSRPGPHRAVLTPYGLKMRERRVHEYRPRYGQQPLPPSAPDPDPEYIP